SGSRPEFRDPNARPLEASLAVEVVPDVALTRALAAARKGAGADRSADASIEATAPPPAEVAAEPAAAAPPAAAPPAAAPPAEPTLVAGDRVTATLSFYYCERGTKGRPAGDGGNFCGAMRDGTVVYDGA